MSLSRRDRVVRGLLSGVATAVGGIVLLIFGFLLAESMPMLWRVGPLRFVSDGSWHPTDGQFNLTPMLIGTALSTVGAVAIATPLGIGSALFRRFYAPPAASWVYGRLIELLAGIPSVVYGLWGLMVLVPLIGRLQPPGASLLAGICILTLMTLPTIALFADSALANIPNDDLRGAAALGLSRWGTIRHVVLPTAKPGLFTGVLLGAVRAVGETMAVLMVTGNVVRVPGGLFDPIRTLTANIALEIGFALGDHRAALFITGLALMAAVVALVSAAESMSPRVRHV